MADPNDIEHALQELQAKLDNADFSLDSLSLDALLQTSKGKQANEQHIEHMKAKETANAIEGPNKQELEDKEQMLFERKPELKKLGPLLMSSKQEWLSDLDSEVCVRLRKHFFERHIVLELEAKNNGETHMRTVKCNLAFDSEGLHIESAVTPHIIEPTSTSLLFVVLHKGDAFLVNCDFHASLAFEAVSFSGKEELNCYKDEFHLEPFSLRTADFFSGVSDELSADDFKRLEAMEGMKRHAQNYQLGYESVEKAVLELIKVYGLTVCGNSSTV